jgi:hypothetical protein
MLEGGVDEKGTTELSYGSVSIVRFIAAMMEYLGNALPSPLTASSTVKGSIEVMRYEMMS